MRLDDTRPDADVLSARWDGHTAEELAHVCDVPHLILLTEVGSTQDLAHQLAEDGAPAGTVVLADAQLAGRGRHGRSWSSPPGAGVWCTAIERPSDPSALDVLSIRVGIRAAEALDVFAGARVALKWPNDLVLPAGKLGGVLTEARWSGGGGTPAWVAIGLGVNVRPPDDVPTAAGLRAGTQRVEVLSAVVRAVRAAAACAGHLSADELGRYRSRDVLVTRRIRAPAQGTVSGIAADGSLLVDTVAGRAAFRTGTIQLAEES